MKKAFISKVAVLFLLVLMLTTVFTSCMAPASTVVTYPDVTNVIKDGESALSVEQLNKIATVVRNNASAWDEFVAAYRGYDVVGLSAADKNKDEYAEQKDINLEAAKKVLTHYNFEGVSVDTISNLKEKDVENIVNAMKLDVELEVESRELFDYVYYYIGIFLGWITKYLGFGNYLVGLCVFAIIIEILMLPLTIKQQKNSIKQALLRPKEMAIRNRYKGRNDQATQQKMAQDVQELYQRENFNPMGGCLPMLIQLPIIMVLFTIVRSPILYLLGKSESFVNALKLFFTTSKAAGGLGETLASGYHEIEMLSQLEGKFEGIKNFEFFTNSEGVYNTIAGFGGDMPSFNVGSVNFGFTPSFERFDWLMIVPVITFLVYFFSMKISKKFTYQAPQNEQAPGAGCSTKAMEFYMPIVSTMFSFMVPAAIGIYWVFRSIVSTFKQFIMSKVMPIPHCTEEDIKAAEKELNAKRPQRKRKSENDDDPNRERPRSLHHIDDDDEEYATFAQGSTKSAYEEE